MFCIRSFHLLSASWYFNIVVINPVFFAQVTSVLCFMIEVINSGSWFNFLWVRTLKVKTNVFCLHFRNLCCLAWLCSWYFEHCARAELQQKALLVWWFRKSVICLKGEKKLKDKVFFYALDFILDYHSAF